MGNVKSKLVAALFISALLLSAIPLFTISSAALPPTDLTGTLNGASYRIQIPNPIETWNRNLVIYCHGYSHTEPQPPLNMGSFSTLVAAGWAVAMSSYGMGGYFISKAMENTYLLTQYVKTTFNVTGKIFLVGISQGGGISLQLAEKYPNLYSGVLDLSGSKDLKMSYQTRIDQLSAKNDSELTAKLQALGASVPPYPFTSLAALQSFNVDQKNDLENATGGTPNTAPKAYEDISATYHANLSVPVITIHAIGDPVNTYAQALAYQAAVAAAGKSSFYRLYATNGTGHVDTTVTSQIATRFLELVTWSSTLDWTMTVDGRGLKAYPDLKETIWQKNATMPPNGQYDKIGLHRLVKTGVTPKGVVLLTNCPTWGMGEGRISNPSTDSFTKYENFSQAIYWANRGFDVYGIDFRTHFAPKPLNASDASYAGGWGLDVWVSDIKEAAEKAKAVSGFSKLFISGECSGGAAALNYATKYWQTDLKGIILLDPNYQAVTSHPLIGTMNATNTYNLTKTLETMRSSNTWAMEDFPQSFKDLSLYALQNPGAPAVNPATNESLSPVLNPLTNRTWANITEWYVGAAYNNFGAYPTMPGLYANALSGYTDISSLEYAIAKSEWLPQRILLENQAMSDWTNCTYLNYDYDDHYKEIGVPVLIFTAQLFRNRTGTFRYVNGINSTLTGVMLNNYGHADVFFGTYSARDVSQPALAWMLNELGLTPRATAFSNATVMTGWTWNFFVHSTAGAGPYSYQWYEGTTLMAGQTKMVLPVTKNTPGTYTYYCKVTDANGATVNSNSVTLTVFS